MVYIVEPARFWGKTKAAHGHNKEKGKLEFTVREVLWDVWRERNDGGEG